MEKRFVLELKENGNINIDHYFQSKSESVSFYDFGFRYFHLEYFYNRIEIVATTEKHVLFESFPLFSGYNLYVVDEVVCVCYKCFSVKWGKDSCGCITFKYSEWDLYDGSDLYIDDSIELVFSDTIENCIKNPDKL